MLRTCMTNGRLQDVAVKLRMADMLSLALSLPPNRENGNDEGRSALRGCGLSQITG